MFKKLRNKMLILNMVLISVIMIVSFVIIYSLVYTNFNIQNQEKLEKEKIINLDGIKNPDIIQNPEFRNNIGKIDKSFSILLDKEGNITRVSSFLELDQEEYERIVNQIKEDGKETGEIEVDGRIWMYSQNELNKILMNSNVLGESYYEISFIDITETKETLNILLLVLIIVGFVMLIIIYFISRYFSNKSIKPVEEIWQKQKQFIADATHELKTPLTIINANIDAVQLNEDSTIKEQEKWINYIKNETKGMNKLINELLVTAKTEEEKYNFVQTNISEIISNLILTVETIIYEKNIELKLDIQKDIEISTEPEKLRQAVLILIDNAIKYTNTKGKISIKLSRNKKSKKEMIFEIENTGEGIKEKDLPYIFDRFYKCDESRTGNSYGLGLFIAKTIITKLNGEIEVTSVVNERTKFKIKLK